MLVSESTEYYKSNEYTILGKIFLFKMYAFSAHNRDNDYYLLSTIAIIDVYNYKKIQMFWYSASCNSKKLNWAASVC